MSNKRVPGVSAHCPVFQAHPRVALCLAHFPSSSASALSPSHRRPQSYSRGRAWLDSRCLETVMRVFFPTKVPYSLFTTSKAEVSRNDLRLFTEDELYLVPGFILSTRRSVVPCMERRVGLSRSLSGPFCSACWERSKFAFSNNRRRVLKSSKQLPEGGREVTNTGCTVTVEK